METVGALPHFSANHMWTVNNSSVVWWTLGWGMQGIKGGFAGHDAPGQLDC